MEVKSLYKYARVSPLKARDVAREIQGLPVSHALDILNFTPRKAAFLIGKTLKSAIANAENHHELDIESLVVKEATATDGPSFRRFKPRARGSGAPIKRRTSHLQIILSDEIEIETRETKKKSKPKSKKKAAPKKEAPKAEAASAAAPEVEAAPAPAETESAEKNLGQVYETAPDQIDDLKVISGVGPGIEEKLHGFGIYTYAQVAAWNEENIAAFDELLSFKGRIERDDWVKQATELEAAKTAE